MIKSDKNGTEVIIESPEDLFFDVKNVIGVFVKFSKQAQVPDEVIEQTLVQMIVDGFKDDGQIMILGGEKE